MPRKLLRRYLPGPARLHDYRPLRFALGELLHDPNLWHLNRRSVAGGLAVGVFCAWVPLPIQMALAGVIALALRVNLPLAVVSVWITNPVTIGPMYWSAWYLGAALLDVHYTPVRFEASFAWVTGEFVRIWKPFGLGCAILGILSAGLAYAACRLAWRYHVVAYVLRRRRKARASTPDR